MLDAEVRAEVLRLFYAEHFTMNSIADALGIHHDTVKEIINTKQFSRAQVLRKSKLDKYLSFIEMTLKDHPRIRATRLHQMLTSRGFAGSVSLLRHRLQSIRPRNSTAFLPLYFLPGEQAQVDWGHFGKIRIENNDRNLYCFVMVLAHSRAIYARFCLDMSQESFQRRHIEGFQFFGGVARRMLYDNLKSVVIERFGRDLRLNRQHLEFAAHYHFKPEACAVRAGWQKGRVERQIRFIRDNFFAARQFSSLSDANRQISEWLENHANKRSWADDREKTVWDIWQDEKKVLLEIPSEDFPTDIILTRRAQKFPFLRFDKNDYSIPFEFVGKPVTIYANDENVRLLFDGKEIAVHSRSFGKANRIRNPEHLLGLLAQRPKGFGATMQTTLVALIPESAKMIKMLIEQDQPTGRHITKILELVEHYGIDAVQDAIKKAVANNVPRSTTIAQMLLQNAQKLKLAPRPEIILPDRPGIADVIVNPHDLSTYDELSNQGECENDT